MKVEKIRKIRPESSKPAPVVEAKPEVPPVQWMHLVPREKVVSVWPKVQNYIKSANEYGLGRFAEHDILAHILAGAWELLVTTTLDAAMVGRVDTYPQKRAYVVILFGGEGDHDWPMVAQAIDERAKALGCNAIDILCRPGWRNILKDIGYCCTHHIYTRELES